MRRKKKIAILKRKREFEQQIIADKIASEILAKNKQLRRKELNKWKAKHNDQFWIEYIDNLRKDIIIGPGNEKLKAIPCTKKRSIIEPY